MPNWTSNRIYVDGDPADIREFLEAVKWEDQLYDFNRIIPRPEILNHTGSGHREIGGKKVESWYILKHAKYEPPQEKEIVRLFTPEEEAELEVIGHRDWYSWSVANWGTKWNASHVQVDEGPGYVEIAFDTAWSPPLPVLRKMVAMFPKLAFDCRWRHEDDSPYPHSLNDEPDDEASALVAQIAGGAHA